MPETAITVENLSKSYLVATTPPRPSATQPCADVLAHNVRHLARKTRAILPVYLSGQPADMDPINARAVASTNRFGCGGPCVGFTGCTR